MSSRIYSVEDAANKLGLHPRTILRFINSGKLSANKVGRQWRIKSEDLNSLLGSSREASEIQASTVIDIPVKNSEEYSRLHNMIIGALNCNSSGGTRVDLIYNSETSIVRVTAWGSPEVLRDLFSLIINIS